jgi:hypothetical protein
MVPEIINACRLSLFQESQIKGILCFSGVIPGDLFIGQSQVILDTVTAWLFVKHSATSTAGTKFIAFLVNWYLVALSLPSKPRDALNFYQINQ